MSCDTFRCCNNSFADLFDIGNVKRAFKTTFKRRPFNVRPYLLILISVLVIMDVQHKGPQPIGLLFFREVPNCQPALCEKQLIVIVYRNTYAWVLQGDSSALRPGLG